MSRVARRSFLEQVGSQSRSTTVLANILARSGQPALRFDPQSEQILDNPEAAALVRRTYRQRHWAVPEGV